MAYRAFLWVLETFTTYTENYGNWMAKWKKENLT